MFNKNKRAKKFSDLLIPGIILIIIGIVFAFQGIRDYSKLNGDLLNLNTASEKDLDADKYVEIDVDYAFYSFCENVETTNYVFKRTTDQYYLISALKDNEYYIGLNIAESKKSELEAYPITPGPSQVQIRVHYTTSANYANQTVRLWDI